MKNIAIIPARSGSKGLKDKNIKLLANKPLLAYSVEQAINSGEFCTVMVSTDSPQYAEIAKAYGGEVPFLRSDENSSDKAGSWDVVKEVLNRYALMEKKYDTVCLLQPTSPLRTSIDINRAYEYLCKQKADSIASVCECDHPMEYMMRLDDSKSLKNYREREIVLPRQFLPTYYRLNGAIYIRTIEYLGGDINIRSQDEYAFVMERDHSVDIDNQEDFAYAEFLLSRSVKGAWE